MPTFSGTAHARQSQLAISSISSISGGWDVEFSDGGKGTFGILAVRSL